MNSPYSQKWLFHLQIDMDVDEPGGKRVTSSQQNCPKLQFLSQSWATQKLNSWNFTFFFSNDYDLISSNDDDWRMMNGWCMISDEDELMMNVDEPWMNDQDIFGSWIMNDCKVGITPLFSMVKLWDFWAPEPTTKNPAESKWSTDGVPKRVKDAHVGKPTTPGC